MSWNPAEDPKSGDRFACDAIETVIVRSEFLLGSGMDVRPHPHIGLSTVTYLFDGEIMHRDSLGTELPIRPGELNWMTAGRGIVHSERTAPELRTTGSKLFGIQSWVALSAKDEETTPAFVHYEAGEMPVLDGDGKTVRIIAGSILGASSPVKTSSPMFYADVALQAGSSVPLIRTMMSGQSTPSPARSRSPATCSRPGSSWYSVPATAPRSGRAAMSAS
jgi:redox-sensitive bicupin YhaK (pirin superfamily)